VSAMDVLAALTGSRVRADLLAALFGGRVGCWKPMELERLIGRSHSPIYRELRRFATVGLLRIRRDDGPQRYEVDTETPVAREIRRLVLQTRGRVPKMRHALVQLRARTIAWYIVGSTKGSDRRRALIVLTSAPKSLVRLQLADLVDPSTEIQCLSLGEWVTRLDKGDVFLRRARGARKLWIVGDWDELTRRERVEIESKKMLQAVRRNWREELSDDWDDDWDPLAPVPGPA